MTLKSRKIPRSALHRGSGEQQRQRVRNSLMVYVGSNLMMEEIMNWDKIAQIQLPDKSDRDEHPRLIVNGYGIHAGSGYTALFPDGWHEITLEVSWEITGPECWYISTPGFEGVCPVGLFVKIK